MFEVPHDDLHNTNHALKYLGDQHPESLATHYCFHRHRRRAFRLVDEDGVSVVRVRPELTARLRAALLLPGAQLGVLQEHDMVLLRLDTGLMVLD